MAPETRQDAVRIYRGGNRTKAAAWPSSPLGLGPFAVYLADDGGYHTLALDFDAGKGSPGDAAHDAAHCEALLRHVGIRAVATRSGPTGGRHLIATFEDPWQAEAIRRLGASLARRFRTLDPSPLRNARTGCLRPPLSLHRDGGRSEPLTAVPEALRTLERCNARLPVVDLFDILGIDPSAAPVSVRRDEVRDLLEQLLAAGAQPLSPRMHGLLGGELQGYQSGSERRFAFLTAACERGWSLALARRALQGSPLLERRGGNRLSELEIRGEWERAESCVALRVMTGQSSSAWLVGTMTAVASGTELKGAERETMLAVLKKAHRAGAGITSERPVAVSIRELASETGSSPALMARMLLRLRDRGALTLCVQGGYEGRRASEYVITWPPAAVVAVDTLNTPHVGVSNPCLNSEREAGGEIRPRMTRFGPDSPASPAPPRLHLVRGSR